MGVKFKKTMFVYLFLVFATIFGLLQPNTGYSQVLHEHFDSCFANNWTTYGGGNWVVRDGAYIIPNGPGDKSVCSALFGDFTYEARINVASGSNSGLIFRVSNPTEGADNFNGYYAFIDPADNLVGLAKMNNNWTYISGNNTTALNHNTWYNLKVVANGTNIKLYLDDQLKVDVNDTSYTTGAVGIRGWYCDTMVDSLTITPTTTGIQEDFNNGTIANPWAVYGGTWTINNGAVNMPAGPGDKAVTAATFSDFTYEARIKPTSNGHGGLIFRVTEPSEGADSFKGYYAYLDPDANWIGFGKMNNNWTYVTGVQTTVNTNQWYDIKVEAYGSNIRIYLDGVLKIDVNDSDYAIGSVGLRGWYLTADIDSLAVSASGYGVEESFDTCIVNPWAIYGGTWTFSDGAVNMPAGPGDKVVTTATFDDFIYEARIRPTSGGNGGLIFRVSDPAEGADSFKGYYAYLEPDADWIGFGKMNNNWTYVTGVQTTVNTNEYYDLKVEAVGSNIKIYLNGVLKIDVTDTDYAGGAIGLRSWYYSANVDSLTITPIDTSLAGIYSISGNDYIGDYTGTVEIKHTGSPDLFKLIRLVDYTSYTYKSYNVSSALEGNVTRNGDSSLSISFALDTAGFLKHADGIVRDSNFNNNMPVNISGTMNYSNDRYSGTFSGTHNSSTYTFNDTWERNADNENNPIWSNQRVDMKTVDDAGSSTIDLGLMVSEYDEEHYNSLPEVSPYVDRQEFKDKIHLWVFDPTDFDYYQKNENKQRLRVIQKIIDPVSLTETAIRNDAYKWKLSEKEAFLSDEAQRIQVNELGMVARWNEAENRYSHDGDSLLWTGVYVATMAKKYMKTNNSQSLEYMLKSLNGVINCIEIVKNSPNDSLGETFARTIMLDNNRSATNPEWRKGTMNYSGHTAVEYKRGGNNDMTKGFFIGMLWGNKALKTLSADDYNSIVVPQYGDIKLRMLNALSALRYEHEALFLNKCRSYKPWEAPKWPNTMHLNLVLYNLIQGTQYQHILDWNADIIPCYDSLKPYWGQTDVNFMNYGGSVSDWSGNHLGIWGLYDNYQNFIDAAGYNSGEANKFRGYLQAADEQMLTHRIGLFRLMAGTLRHQPNHQFWIDQAIWRLKEIPLSRGGYEVDWTINPKFTVSPYPELLWKYKKSEAASRIQSLRAYPLFESTTSSYYWKDNPFKLFQGVGLSGQSGLDFLIAYWFGRYHDVITPEM